MLKLIWRETALNDLDRIILYIGSRNYPAALRLQMLMEDCAERLTHHPYLHRRGRIPETREAVVHPNYVMVYRVGSDAVEVLNVVHSRQQYPPEQE